jgi:SAM-dependent methyltransferase
MPVPADVIAARAHLTASILGSHSAGIEIGALDAATPVPAGCTVRYVDVRSDTELAAHYRRADPSTFVHVDVVEDGETLRTFPPASVDFILAQHVLEHFENPLGAMRRHLDVVRPSGWLFYALPDRRLTEFDADRELTTFEHLLADHADAGVASRDAHYLEWAHTVNRLSGDEARAHAGVMKSRRRSIHFHVWDANTWLEALLRARAHLRNAFDVRRFEFTGTEILCVLRRADAPVE